MFVNLIYQALQEYLVTRNADLLGAVAKMIDSEQSNPSLQPVIVRIKMTGAEMVAHCEAKGSLKLKLDSFEYDDGTDNKRCEVFDEKLIRVMTTDQDEGSTNIFMLTYVSETMIILSPLGVRG